MNTENRQAAAAAEFATRWQGRGYERGDSQIFWADLLTNVYGVKNIAEFIRYEEQVRNMVDSTNFIDGHIPSTRVLIEQKSLGRDLRKGGTQSDGSVLNPFEQAKRYVANMPLKDHPRWIVTCNFAEFLVYDMEHPTLEPEHILLCDLGREYYRLQFLVDAQNEHVSKEMRVSMEAGRIVGRIYDALLVQYGEADHETLRWLNILCVRIVFCLYAEDAGIFRHDQFYDYLTRFDAPGMRQALLQLFDTLNRPEAERSRFLRDELKAFPYTNGGLFAEEIEIPQFTEELRQTLLQNASLDFDWSEISPTIFGAVFESTLNPQTRRSGGMHYTSIENIHKVIDPLFLDGLRRELDTILGEKVERQRQKRLDAFQDRLASLTFLDPACGSGNFLTETYLSLRRLENEAIRERYHGQTMMGAFMNPVKVSIQQFYGIEINDFAVTVATTALWISEAQMLRETERIVRQDIDFLPLRSYTNIREANALRTDWETVVPRAHLNYIIGNPPFVGYSLQSQGQKEDILSVFVDVDGKPFKTAGKIDYVAGWYYKAAQLMQHTSIKAALVSTNSITQGEQVAAIWKPLKEMFGTRIDFARRTFRWDSEATQKAHVHCVVIGFSTANSAAGVSCTIYDGEHDIRASHINGYLIDADDVFVEPRTKPLCDVPQMCKGSQPTDGGNLILSAEERAALIQANPELSKYVRPFVGADEFINGNIRYCLWLADANPSEIRHSAEVMRRVQAVRDSRMASPKAATRKWADYPMLFTENRQPKDTYILVPSVSSERRRYVPMGFVAPDVVASNLVLLIPNATLYHFGILESTAHMAWMRAVCGRLKSDYRYSANIVYNNFPWPSPLSAAEVTNSPSAREGVPFKAGERESSKIRGGQGGVDLPLDYPRITPAQQERIAQTAQAILDARALYPDSSLADLYDELTMPAELRRAHRQNDEAVAAAYGFDPRLDESQAVALLFKMYQKLTKQ